jgi:acetoin utilization deacetylase AcuC-like enzyme
MQGEVGVWYHPEYALSALTESARAAGVEPRRAELILGVLAREGLLRPEDVRAPGRAEFAELRRVHSVGYLDSTTDPGVLGHIFGLEPGHVDVEAILLAERRAVGGTLAAAAAASRGETRIAFNLGAGFHHAEPEQGAGFCVYNDVGVAIAHLRANGFAAPIAIVDLDYHQGNGNLVLFARDPSVLTYSIHGAVWSHAEAVSDVGVLLPTGTDDAAYLSRLQDTLPPALRDHRPGLVFYLAGNDVLAGDRLGAFALTQDGVLARDRFVVELASSLGAPLVVTLAGGYSAEAWACSVNLLRWLLTGEERTQPLRRPDVGDEFARIAAEIDPSALQLEAQKDPFAFDEQEIIAELDRHPPARRLLDFYTLPGIEYALERYGLLDLLRQRGFHDLRVSIDPSERARQMVRIHGRRGNSPPLLLVEVAVQRLSVPSPPGLDPPGALELLSVEWLLLQDPTASFTLERPRFPGQEFPGLGVAAEVQELLLQVCQRLGLEGLINAPSHYHMAYVGARRFRFLRPADEGRFLAMRRALADEDLALATRLVDEGRLKLGDGATLSWNPGRYVLALSDRLKRYFADADYVRASEAECVRLSLLGLHVEEAPPPAR